MKPVSPSGFLDASPTLRVRVGEMQISMQALAMTGGSIRAEPGTGA